MNARASAEMGARFRWVGEATPANEVLRMIRDAIVDHGLTRFDEIVAHVAASLWETDCRRSGWLLGTALFKNLYVDAARQAVEDTIGRELARDVEPRWPS